MQQIANTQQAAAWNGDVGTHWAEHADRYDTLVSGFNEALFAAAAIGAREHVLDVGCGNGQTTRLAARHATLGHAVGIDISAPMLARARASATQEDLRNITFVQGDAQVYPFQPGTFDVAISRGGVMFFADHVAAFANIGRALRSGGRLAFITPQPADPQSESARVFRAFGAAVQAHPNNGNAEADELERAMFSLADPDRIHTLLTAAGFQDVIVTAVAAPVYWGRDASDAAAFFLAMSRNRLRLASLDEAVREQVRHDIRLALQRYETAEGVSLPGAVWLVRAVRP
jgi:ubiquinone/menaquinone biosynthesis C-methylase UbiE